MWRLPAMVMVVAAWGLNAVSGQDVKNVRMTYGVQGAANYGATRTNDKFLPGETLLLAYDIAGLSVSKKLQTASWEGSWEILDANKKKFGKAGAAIPAQDVVVQLGGNSVPGQLFVEMPKVAAGTYYVKLTLTDRMAKQSKEYLHKFEIGKADEFGFFGLTAPAFGVTGTQLPISFGVANTPVWDKETDKKKGLFKKAPRVDITMRVFDAGNRTELGLPMRINWPLELPEIFRKELIPAQFSIYLNRPGRFRAEIEAHDHITDKKLKVEVPFTVLDLK
jgi:hypothetical protein